MHIDSAANFVRFEEKVDLHCLLHKFHHLAYLLITPWNKVFSWETNRSAAAQEIPRILWNPNVYYRFHKCPPRDPILSHINPVHVPPSYFLKIHLNIMLSSMRGSPKWSLSLRFLHQNPAFTTPLPHTCYMHRPSHSSRLDHPNNIWWGVQIIKLLVIKCVPFPCYLVPLRPKYSPQHPILKYSQPTFLTQCKLPNFIICLVTFSQSLYLCVFPRVLLRLIIALSVNKFLDSS